MNFRKFPLDVQSCKIKFGSYGYTVDDLTMKWFNVNTTNCLQEVQNIIKVFLNNSVSILLAD